MIDLPYMQAIGYALIFANLVCAIYYAAKRKADMVTMNACIAILLSLAMQ